MDKQQPECGKYRLEIDGDWELMELSGFGRQYVQVYSFLYAFEYGMKQEPPDHRMFHAFKAFPWIGGWSAVNFYETLRVAVPGDLRPRVVSIRYASPGFIELAVGVAIALSIRKIVDYVCSSIERCNAVYNRLHQDASERRLLKARARREEFNLMRAEFEFAEQAVRSLSEAVGLDITEELQRLTPDPIVRMKIWFSLYRRIRDLAKLQDSNKMRF